ncbi:MAG: NAD(P)-binding domain-containing protein [Pilosibacter sp.]
MAKIGFIGMGNMGTAIMRGLLKTYKPEELLFTSAHEAKMRKLRRRQVLPMSQQQLTAQSR